ncbi:hypothetical protein J2P12_07250 [Candidatus Bathyarchaeota archaeon]|nr:hypothetical protein [Candidatus Bathyarchaeota archaeon]
MSLSFEDLVRVSIHDAVATMMGDKAVRAVSFYFDLRMVARDPESFARIADGLFGAISGELKKAIVKNLLSKMGRPVPPILEGTRLDDWYSTQSKRSFSEFQDWIRRARDTFSSLNTSSSPWSGRQS